MLAGSVNGTPAESRPLSRTVRTPTDKSVWGIIAAKHPNSHARKTGFRFFLFLFMASQRSGTHLKSFLEAVRFIRTEYQPVSSHGEPI